MKVFFLILKLLEIYDSDVEPKQKSDVEPILVCLIFLSKGSTDKEGIIQIKRDRMSDRKEEMIGVWLVDSASCSCHGNVDLSEGWTRFSEYRTGVADREGGIGANIGNEQDKDRLFAGRGWRQKLDWAGSGLAGLEGFHALS